MLRPQYHQSTRPTPSFLILFGSMLSILLTVSACDDTREDDTTYVDQNTQLSVPEPLTVLVIGSPALSQNLARQWAARRDGSLSTIDQTLQQWSASKLTLAPEVDIVIYPPGLVGELAVAGRLEEFPRSVWESDEINKQELLPQARRTLVTFDSRTWAVPLGSPPLLLMYRQDLFEKSDIEVPETWEEFSATLRQIEAADFEQPAAQRIRIPNSPGWAANLLLARVAASIRHRGTLSSVFDRNSMKPLLNSPPFVAALEDLKKLADASGWTKQTTDPGSVYTSLITGDSVMGIGWPAAGLSDDQSTEAPLESIGISSLPGSDRWYDRRSEDWIERTKEDQSTVDLVGFAGLVGSVSTNSRNTGASFEFLQWLCSKPVSLIVLAGMPESGPFRASHLGNPQQWTGESISPAAAISFADAIHRNQSSTVGMIFPRLPGYLDYLNALDDETQKCLEGKIGTTEALQRACNRWEEITNGIGRKKQIKTLRQSSGL